MKSKIVAFDHADSALAEVMKLCGILVVADLHEVEGAEIAICHVGDNEDAWKAMLSKSKTGSIRIRTSSVGREKYTHKIQNGAVILELQISHDPDRGGATSEQWEEILTALDTKAIATKIINGDVPVSLVKYFGRAEMLEILPALSILCQGFIGIWREVMLAADVPAPEGIMHALELMGWDKVPSEIRDSVRKRFGEETPDAVGEQDKKSFEDLCNPSWWHVFDDNSPNALKTQVENELRMCKADNKAVGDILQLVKHIAGPKETSDNMPEMVALAYIAIHSALERS